MMKTLKKIIKFFRNLFRTIGSFIDKFIVTPVTKFAMFIGEKADKGAGKFERWLNKRNTLIFVSVTLTNDIAAFCKAALLFNFWSNLSSKIYLFSI